MMRQSHRKVEARIVFFLGAILASFITVKSATLDVNLVSPTGVTNLTRAFISGTVGNGNILQAQGTNIVGLATNNLGGGTITYNTDQFGTNTTLISIKDGVVITNLSVTGSLTENGVDVLTNIPPAGANNAIVIWLTTNSQSFIPNGIGMLTNDGNGNFGYTTNISQDISLISVTISNSITTNQYFITGKGNTLIITNALQLLSLSSSVLMVTASGVVTNVTLGAGLSLASQTLTANDTTKLPLAGGIMTGDILTTDNSFNLGAASTRWKYVFTSGSYYGTNGSAVAPIYSYSASTNSGMYLAAVNRPAFAASGFWAGDFDGNGFQAKSIHLTTAFNGGSDAIITREGAAIIQFGDDATAQNTPTSQTIKGPDGLAGTGTNINGANLTIAAGRNTGSGTGGSLLFQTAPAGSSGTSAGTLTTRLTIPSTGIADFTAIPTVNGVQLLTNSTAGTTGSTNYRSSVIWLTTTGTNVDSGQIDWLKTNQCYAIVLTNNVFFSDVVCTNVPDTNSFQYLQLDLIQDATGGRTVTFTNSIFAGVNGTFAITSTSNSWDSLTLLNSRQTNGNVAVIPVNNLKR